MIFYGLRTFNQIAKIKLKPGPSRPNKKPAASVLGNTVTLGNLDSKIIIQAKKKQFIVPISLKKF